MENPDELEKLRILFNECLAKGSIVMSENMTVNGTYYRPIGFSFIVVQSASDSRIHKFHFTGFKTSIACFRTVEKGVISDSTFSHNYIVGGIGMLMFGVGKCKLDVCNITENTILNTSLIAMFSTHLYLNMTWIERNYVQHQSSQAMLYAINSVCEYTNTTIRRNSSPWAPLHLFEFRSCFGFWNCTWEENHHHEILLCDGTCEFNFSNNTIINNFGVFLSASANSIVSFNESIIINNFSGDRPLFDIPGGNFFTFHPISFIENSGKSLIDLSGLPGVIQVKYASFIKNKFLDSMLIATNNSRVHLSNSSFYENIVSNGSLNIQSSILRIEECNFSRNRPYSLKMSDSRSLIINVAFIDNEGHPGSSVFANGGFTKLVSSYFRGNSIGGQIHMKGMRVLLGNRFFSKKESLILKKYQSECFLCSYNTPKMIGVSIIYIIIVYVILFFIIVFLFFIFGSKLSKKIFYEPLLPK